MPGRRRQDRPVFGATLPVASALVAMLFLGACGDGTGPAGGAGGGGGGGGAAAVATVNVTPPTTTLGSAGDNVQLMASALDAGGATLTGKTFTWASSDPTVITVDGAGLATAAGPNGMATITATSESIDGTATIDVTTGTAGGTVSAAGGQVTLVVPAGAVATPVTVTVAPVSVPPANPGLVANTTFDFGPNGTTFAQPVQLTIEYDPADIPSGIMEADLLLQAVVNSVWQPVPGSTVDEAANTVTGSINSFSEYGIAAAPMPSSITGEWNGSAATSPSLDFIVDVVDNNGTLNLSAPISYGLTGTSLVGTGTRNGFDVVMNFDEFMGPTYWVFTGVMSGDGQTITGELTGPGNPTTFPALTSEPLVLIRQ